MKRFKYNELQLYRCLNCGKEFRDFKAADRKYCTEQCYHESLVKKGEIYIDPSKVKKTRRKCLGIKCRGVKTFWSEGPQHRICWRCKAASKKNNEDAYNQQ